MSGQTTEWGALITLPNGAPDVELCTSRGHAMVAVDNINRRPGGAAKLVYRLVEYGPWITDGVGDEWGVRSTWTDGVVEITRQPSRELAEAYARSRLATSSRVLVSRTKQVSDWWLAEVPA